MSSLKLNQKEIDRIKKVTYLAQKTDDLLTTYLNKLKEKNMSVTAENEIALDSSFLNSKNERVCPLSLVTREYDPTQKAICFMLLKHPKTFFVTNKTSPKEFKSEVEKLNYLPSDLKGFLIYLRKEYSVPEDLIGTKYRHYKGTDYIVINVAYDLDSEKLTYLYGKQGDEIIWARDAEDFQAILENGTPRFTRLEK